MQAMSGIGGPLGQLLRRLRRPPMTKEAYLQAQKHRGTYAFIHINKCGGTSVERALGLPKIHDTARQRRDVLGAARWSQLWSFALVRHPYDKVCSHYRFRIKTNQTSMGQRPPDLNDWVLRAYGDKDPAWYDKPLMFAPCTDWIVDEQGAVIVSHVSRLEDIASNWPVICAAIGSTAPLSQENATVPGARGADLLSAEARAVLDRHFAPDFARFGYQT